MKNSKYDIAWSKAVKIRAHNKCEFEGCYREAKNSHHFFSRRFKSTRYDVNCGFALCVAHHFFAHQRPAEFVDWAKNKRGQVWYDMLRIKSHKIKYDVTGDILYCMQIVKGNGKCES